MFPIIWFLNNFFKWIQYGCHIFQSYFANYSGFKGNIRTDEHIKLKSSRSFKTVLAATLNCTLCCCDERGIVTLPCCHTLFVSDGFCGLGLSSFWGSTDDEKISRPNRSVSYKALESETKHSDNHYLPSLTIFLFLFTNMMLMTLLILAVCRTHVIWTL